MEVTPALGVLVEDTSCALVTRVAQVISRKEIDSFFIFRIFRG